MTEPPKTRKYRYSLRFLMLFVLVAALWLGWRVEQARTQKRAIEAVKNFGGWVISTTNSLTAKSSPAASPVGPNGS